MKKIKEIGFALAAFGCIITLIFAPIGVLILQNIEIIELLEKH